MRRGKEAVEEWRRYFERVLNEGGSLKGQSGREMGVDENGLFDEEITREEVEQALGKLKQKAAPGSDGLTAEMVSSKELVGFWHCLLNWCCVCSIIHARLAQVVEEKNLVAEEQDGFGRGRGCRDQLLTLVLLGQIKTLSNKYFEFKKLMGRQRP